MGLPATAVVHATGQIDHRQRGWLAVFRALVAVMKWLFVWPGEVIRFDEADHRRGRPIAFATWHGYCAIGQQAQSVGVAKACREHLNFVSPRLNADQPLLA